MRREILVGGKAGQGPNFLGELIAQGLIKKGYYVFYSRDYQSLIRGGHNFNQISVSGKEVYSNSSEIDILVCLDDKTRKIHEKKLKKDAIILDYTRGKGNAYYAGVLFRALKIEFSILDSLLKKYKFYEENLSEAKDGFENGCTSTLEKSCSLRFKDLGILPKKIDLNKLILKNGSEAIAVSSLKSGLDFYYAYPMTPATPLMMELGMMQLDEKNKHRVIELENEIAVALTGMGSSVVGKRVMVGTSGGGFDLMTESLSLSAMAEIPLVFYLAQRPGPGTGVATYTSQGDLNLALHSGHGEFFRFVVSPGDNEDCVKLTNDAFHFSYKYRIPSIILIDKHLAESKGIYNEKESLKKIKEIKNPIKIGERFNSYEHDLEKDSIATEEAEIIKKNFERRALKEKEIEKEIENFETIKIYGNKNSKNLIISWGGTKGAILDSINYENLDAKFTQVLYMNPFPSKHILKEINKSKNVLIVENNFDSPLSRLIREKTGFKIEDKNKILRYDGRPFLYDELSREIRKRLK